MRLTGVLATHYHPITSAATSSATRSSASPSSSSRPTVPIHVQRARGRHGSSATTGVGRGRASWRTTSDDVLEVGEIAIRLLHTPGHTPGSQCFLVDGRLVAGDTLFLRGCGRTDLPGQRSQRAMYDSLVNRLAKLPDDTVVYPGHLYSPEASATLGETNGKNPVLAPRRRRGMAGAVRRVGLRRRAGGRTRRRRR